VLRREWGRGSPGIHAERCSAEPWPWSGLSPVSPDAGAVAIRVSGEGGGDMAPSPPSATTCDTAAGPARACGPSAGRERGAPLPSSAAALPCPLPYIAPLPGCSCLVLPRRPSAPVLPRAPCPRPEARRELSSSNCAGKVGSFRRCIPGTRGIACTPFRATRVRRRTLLPKSVRRQRSAKPLRPRETGNGVRGGSSAQWGHKGVEHGVHAVSRRGRHAP
jgi:hypothetical protein